MGPLFATGSQSHLASCMLDFNLSVDFKTDCQPSCQLPPFCPRGASMAISHIESEVAGLFATSDSDYVPHLVNCMLVFLHVLL